jgi:hypothetical protein
MKHFKRHIIIMCCVLFITKCFAQPAGNSLLFNGITDYVTVPDNSLLDFTDSFSFESWINPHSSTNHLILRKGGCFENDFSYYVDIIDGKISIGWLPFGNCGNELNLFRTDNTVIEPFECTHIAVVFSPISINIYINGNIVPSSFVSGSFSTIHNSSDPLLIGVSIDINNEFGNYFIGEIDEFRIWNYALSENEINSRINTSLFGYETGLVAYYDFEELGTGAGLTVLNNCISSGTALNGTTIGSAYSPSHIPRCNNKIVNTPFRELIPIKLYPNPSDGNFTLYLDTSYDFNNYFVTIKDNLSQIVFDELINQEIYSFNLHDKLAAGIYYLELIDLKDYNIFATKIIIE